MYALCLCYIGGGGRKINVCLTLYLMYYCYLADQEVMDITYGARLILEINTVY